MRQRIVIVLGVIILAMSALAACGQPAAPDPTVSGGSPTRGGRTDAEGMLP